MSAVYVHLLNLKGQAQDFSVTLPCQYAVVRGQSSYGQDFGPVTCTPEFHIVGGLLGVPYHGDLGRAGVPCAVTFPNPVSGVWVATYSPNQPAGAVFASKMVVGSYYNLQGSGTAVKQVSLSLGGVNYVRVSWPAGQPLDGYQFDYPVGYVWKGPESLKPGYTLIENGVQPL